MDKTMLRWLLLVVSMLLGACAVPGDDQGVAELELEVSACECVDEACVRAWVQTNMSCGLCVTIGCDVTWSVCVVCPDLSEPVEHVELVEDLVAQ